MQGNISEDKLMLKFNLMFLYIIIIIYDYGK